MLIERILSGDQSGVDRAACDVATVLSVPWGGYSQGDIVSQPDLKSLVGDLREVRLERPSQVMEWNVRDSDAVLILIDNLGIGCSIGTVFVQQYAAHYCRPTLIIDVGDYMAIERATAWLLSFRASLTLNVAGPRVGESPGIYEAAFYFLEELLERSRH
jgi:hypothetical protein